MRAAAFALLLLALPAPAFAQASADETAVRGVIAKWYAELQRKKLDPDTWRLHSAGFIDGGPRGVELNPRSAARSPMLSSELAAQALQFAYDIDSLKVEPTLAKVQIWERGYFYAWSPKSTYEMAARATFVLEKQRDGSWAILAHAANSEGIPPNRITNPMPDLRALWEKQNPDGPK